MVRCISFSLLASLSLWGCGPPKTPLEETVEKTFEISPAATIRIDNGDGSVRIYGAPGSQMRMIAIKRAYTFARLKKIDVKISAAADSVSIQTVFPPVQKWGISDRSGTVDYVIVVPDTANLVQANLNMGEVLLEGMRGQQARAEVGTGRLFVHDCYTNLRVRVDTGPLVMIYDWWEPRNSLVEATVTNGTFSAWLPGSASFRLLAAAQEIWNDFSPSARRSISPAKIDSVIGVDPMARFSVDVVHGNIKILKAYP